MGLKSFTMDDTKMIARLPELGCQPSKVDKPLCRVTRLSGIIMAWAAYGFSAQSIATASRSPSWNSPLEKANQLLKRSLMPKRTSKAIRWAHDV